MPELPEVEVLVQHLRPLIRNRTIRRIQVHRAKVVAPHSPAELRRRLTGAQFTELRRRGKYLLFELRISRRKSRVTLLGHLGMSGRMFLARRNAPLPKHTSVVIELDRNQVVLEDPRYFGRLTLETRPVEKLGPEPFSTEFNTEYLAKALARSSQAIKVKLLDQSLVAGIGNIYASEALFRAGVSPRLPADKLNRRQISQLCRAIQQVLTEAIRFGSTVPLNFAGGAENDGLFYFGRAPNAADYYEERLRVYDRAGQPCPRCKRPIQRLVQAARSTFYCPRCQRS